MAGGATESDISRGERGVKSKLGEDKVSVGMCRGGCLLKAGPGEGRTRVRAQQSRRDWGGGERQQEAAEASRGLGSTSSPLPAACILDALILAGALCAKSNPFEFLILKIGRDLFAGGSSHLYMNVSGRTAQLCKWDSQAV